MALNIVDCKALGRSALTLAVIVLAGAQAAAAPQVPKARLTGTWDRSPDVAMIPTQQPPLKPQYQAERAARQKAAREADQRGEPLLTDNAAECLPDGMPGMMMAPYPMEVLQTPGQITIIAEAYAQIRRIYLNEKQLPIEDAEPGYWGHEVGRWDSDTLVVNTVGIKPSARFLDVPHSDQMQVDERIRLLSPDSFEDQITVTDPVYFTAPWTFGWKYVRRSGYKMLEYVCENNREFRDPQTGGTRLRFDQPKAGGQSQPAAPQK
jgi:hypothetical protein